MSLSKALVFGTSDEAISLCTFLAERNILTLVVGSTSDEANAIVTQLKDQSSRWTDNPDNVKYLQGSSYHDLQTTLPHAGWVFIFDETLPASILETIAKNTQPTCLILACTSNITRQSWAEKLPEPVRDRFHRIMIPLSFRTSRIIELVSEGVEGGNLALISDLLQRHLGLTIIQVHDRPGPIHQRLETSFLSRAIQLLEQGKCTVEELDLISGPLLGRGYRGCLGKVDALGLARVQSWMQHYLGNSSAMLALLIEHEQGFYKKTLTGAQVFRPMDGKHSPMLSVELPELKELEQKSVLERFQLLPHLNGRSGELLWTLLSLWFHDIFIIFKDALTCTHDLDELTRRACHWELGPFELLEHMGLQASCERLQTEGVELPLWLSEKAASNSSLLNFRDGALISHGIDGHDCPRPIHGIPIRIVHRLRKPVITDKHCALWDLDDGIYLLDLLNPTASPAQTDSLRQTLERAHQEAMGIILSASSEGNLPHTDLRPLALAASRQDWEQARKIIQHRQLLNQTLRYSPLPVLTCSSFPLLKGAGLELAWHTDGMVLSSSCRLSLHEPMSALLASGGGLKQLSIRQKEKSLDLNQLQKNFEALLSGQEVGGHTASKLAWILPTDIIHPGCQETILADTKMEIHRLHRLGYRPPIENPTLEVCGEDGLALLHLVIYQLEQAERINSLQSGVAKALARVLSGGEVGYGTTVDERYLLDLELDANLSLLSRPETLNRISQTLNKH